MNSMSKPKSVAIPKNSRLAGEPYDWFDAYEIVVDDEAQTLDTWSVCEVFLADSPWWARLLFAVRNTIVRWVGLKADSIDMIRSRQLLDNFRTRPESEFPRDIGVVGAKVFSASNREITAGADDWHLDFRGSLLVEPMSESHQTLVTLTTVVRFKHGFGRLYFLPVKPFHKLIIRSMLQRLARRFSKREKI